MKIRRASRAAAAFVAMAALFALAPAAAQAGTYGERLVAEGTEFFRAGNFFRASESYRCAVLEEPADGTKKLAFGHSLFALGNYAYAAYSFRRGVRYLGYPDDLRVDLAGLFPSRLSYERAIRDVRRYASYYPSDPHALTVIAYTAYFSGDRPEAEAACKRLLGLDARDAFAAYLLRRIEAEAGGAPLTPMPVPEPTVVASQPRRGAAAQAAQVPSIEMKSGGGAIAPISGPARSGGSPESAIVLRRPAPRPAPPLAPAFELPQGERSGPAETLSREELGPALAR